MKQQMHLEIKLLLMVWGERFLNTWRNPMLSKKKFQKIKNTTLVVFRSLLLFGKILMRKLVVLMEYLKKG